ncbi:SIMPL domain-containing protein [Nocardioides sp. CN2-186]|uniref:SIMPL domain-containing protein n=1 Tax=Nocardioides tweenelious TaxID=3156607 RepID=UPI0032B56957
MTVSVRSIVITAVVALALVAAYVLGSAGGGPANAADDESSSTKPDHRVLTMSGTGEATAVPDELSFAVAVSLTRDDLDTALDDANAAMERVLASQTDYDVARSDVQTTGLSMTPVYDYHQYSPPTIRGYRVSERARVLVKDVKQGGSAVSAAVAAGGNDVRVSDIRLLVGDSDAVMAEARDAAVAEAKAKAEQYAEASGQELGEVMTLREVHARPVPTPTASIGRGAMAYDSAMVGLSKTPIRAGKETGKVTVQIVWSLA